MGNYMYKLSFVILHYLVNHETEKAVESILEKMDLPISEYAIIVVDNASPNGSGKILKSKYATHENIFVILNAKNEGFSAGNNKGFLFAKKKLGSKFIVLMNNDITLLSGNFYNKIEHDYEKYKYAALGPRLYKSENHVSFSNPAAKEDYGDKRLKLKKFDLRILLLLNPLGLDLWYSKFRRWLPDQIFRILKKKRTGTQTLEYYGNVQENVMIQGCFLVFSPLYVGRFDGLEEITFMYHEELILYMQIVQNNMQMIYDPEIMVFHGHSVSTNNIHTVPKKNRWVSYKLQLDSLNNLFQYLKEIKGVSEWKQG